MGGIEQCVEYIASIGERYDDIYNDEKDEKGKDVGKNMSTTPITSNRRENIVAGWKVIREHENRLKTFFLNSAEKIQGLRVYGVTDPTRVKERTATFAVSFDGMHPEVLCQHLTDNDIYCTSGNHYCTFWNAHYGHVGLNNTDGVTRIGFLHYNTMEDVEKVLKTLE